VGLNSILRAGQEIKLPGKGSLELKAGDILIIKTPGGGGWGKK
jgi:5-oxoprolinase (ATP-hydrolysing)